MLQQFRFTDVLNIISIGVLFQIAILLFLYCIYPDQIVLLIQEASTKDRSPITIAVSLIITIPLWRLISSFVETLMYPIELTGEENKVQKFIIHFNSTYKSVFFLLFKKSGIKQGVIISSELASTLKSSKITQDNIKSKFNIELTELVYEDYRQLFYTIKSFTTINNPGITLYFSQYNTVYNFQTRLTILLNICTLLSLILYVRDLLDSGFIFVNRYLLAIAILYALTVYFANTLKVFGKREIDLMINDFNATCASIDAKSK